MTNTEILTAGKWSRVRNAGECGKAIVTRGPLFGLACSKSATWKRGDSPAECTQHAVITQEWADLLKLATTRGYLLTQVDGRMPYEVRRQGSPLMSMNFRTTVHLRRWLQNA